MHPLSVYAIGRATKRLAEHTGEKLGIRIYHNQLAEIFDDNGEIVSYDINPPNLVRRIKNIITEGEIRELLDS